MDDIFGNWVYIILLIASFVISALGKKKKKRPNPMISKPSVEPERVEERPTSSLNFEELIKEQLGIQNEYENDFYETETEPKIDTTISQVKEKPLDRVPEYMLDDKEDIPFSIEYDNTESEIEQEIEHEEKEESEEKSILEGFDLQDAVIYSEILNRKEY